jgi:uncharacterized protein (DUF885 family)
VRSSARLVPFLLALACTHPQAPVAEPPPQPGPARSSPEASARLFALAEEYFEGKLRLDPLLATSIGDSRYDDRLPDTLSDSGRAAIRDLAASTRAKLEKIPRAELAGEDALTWAVLDDLTRTTLEGLELDDHLMPVEQLNCLAVQLPVYGSGGGIHPFRTVADYDHFLARIRAFPAWVDAAIARMREGMQRGYTQPRPVVERTLPQLAAQVVARPEDSTFWGPLTRMPSSFPAADQERLTGAYREAIARTLVPAYRRLAEFVRNTYLPAARETIAVEALPDGPARYAFQVRQQTTTRLDPHAIHQLGLDEVARIQGEVEALRIASRFEGTSAQFLEAMFTDPSGAVRTEAELVAGYAALKERVRPRLPELFGKLPAADFEVRPVERFRENAAPSQYVPATWDGKRAGVFYVNAGVLRARAARPSQSLFLHEALPGHHLQVSLAAENRALPRIRRYAEYNAYVEGWALYAEGLGRQLGLYRELPQQAGQLRSELFRAVRLVVDTGLHHEGWSRQRALDYVQSTLRRNTELEIDRYIASPAQALGYKLGEIAIVRMRKDAERRLGSAFDLRAFHDAVLESGPLPLDLLEAKMRAWAPEH